VLGLLVAMLLVLLVTLGDVRAEQLQTFRDDKGRVTGQATTRGSSTTFQDA
jgi:hypothetical protein